mmetsp:Transcript_23121/g.41264  ORF Transcript_23121/g.41264 Transcript_23121/m.41264 type:complete len:1044 (+) Transcript_23121:18-3149(+)
MPTQIMWTLPLLLVGAKSLELFIVPHSHCDPGWIEPIDYYYDNHVKFILSNIITLLDGDEDRRFVWSETSFLERWYAEQKKETQKAFADHIKSGRLEIVGGGWVQNDEALTDFETVISQLERGHSFLNKTFGISHPKVAWQIDPFGHSAITPTIMQKFGFEELVINRIDERFKEQIRESGDLEFMWEGADMGRQAPILTHVLYDHYDFPPILNPKLGSYCWRKGTEDHCANQLVQLIKAREKCYKSNKVMLLYGNDFFYDKLPQAEELFSNIEKIIKHINKTSDFGIKARLSTASEYFSAVRQTKVKLHSFSGDFLPLMNTKDSPTTFYWTGYYASRPESKRRIVTAHDFVRTGKMLSALVLKEDFDTKNADVGLHHDGITGTNRDHVAQSFDDLANSAIREAEVKITEAFIMLSNHSSKTIASDYKPLVIFNPVNWERSQLVSFESKTSFVKVLDADLKLVASEAAKTPEDEYLIFFNSNIEGLSFKTYFIVELQSECEGCAKLIKESEEELVLRNGAFEVTLEDNCYVKTITQGDLELELNAKFFKYGSYRGGAYLFAPSSDGEDVEGIILQKCSVYNGDIASVSFAKWKRSGSLSKEPYTQRLVIGQVSDSVEWQLYVSPGFNEELFLRFDSDSFKDHPSWFHTFNSGDLRRRLHRKKFDSTVAGMNYYPIPGALILGKFASALTLVTETPTGAGLPYKDRVVDIHLHRNMQQDDNFGLAGRHNDESTTTHCFHVSLGEVSHKALWHKFLTGKHRFQLFTVPQLKPFALKTTPLQQVEALSKPWPYTDDFGIGLASQDIYVSSASWKVDKTVVRLLEIADHNAKADWDNLELLEACNLGGFDNPKQVKSLAGDGYISDNLRETSGQPVALRTNQPLVKINNVDHEGLQAYTANFQIKPMNKAKGAKDAAPQEEKHEAEEIPLKHEAKPTATPSEATVTDSEVAKTKDTDDTPAETPENSEDSGSSEDDPSLQDDDKKGFLEKNQDWTEETLDNFSSSEPIVVASNAQDIEALEYAVVVGLSMIAALSILAYYRYKKRRRD